MTDGRTKKVLDIQLDGFHLTCIRTADKRNPYRVYRVWAGHRRQIAKYGDFLSVVYFISDIYRDGVDTAPIQTLIDWAKRRGCL
jgi:hypothetical protein